MLLQGTVGYERADYVGSGAMEIFYRFGLSTTWRLDRNIRLSVSYNLIDHAGITGGEPLISPVKGGTYLQNVVLVRIGLQL